MGLNYLPDYRLTANKRDITAMIRDRFVSLSYTDESGHTSDVLNLVLTDHLPAAPLLVPACGAELELSLGYAGALTTVGVFVVDEVELSGEPRTMAIRARATGFDQVKRDGVGNLKTQKTRAWPKDTKLGDLVKTVASEHGLISACSYQLADTVLPQLSQVNESDLNFLTRLAQTYGAAVKCTNGRLVFAPHGTLKTVSGKSLPAITLTPSQVSSWRVTLAERDTSGTVVATWHSTSDARMHEVKVGEGEPTITIKDGFPSEELAQAAARSDWLRRQRGGTRLTVDLVGRPDLVAEGRLRMSGFREGVNGDWSITRAEHTLDNGGYRTSIEAELPNEYETSSEQDSTEEDNHD